MELLEIFGFVGALVIGITLGLTGGGGSILTVPVLVYLFKLDPVMGTAYSLFIVGLTSLIGSFSFAKKGLVSFKTAIIFGIPSIFAVYLTRKFIVPALPDVLFTAGTFEYTKEIFMMSLFAVLMIVTSFSMIRKKKKSSNETTTEEKEQKFNVPLILVEGLIVGTLTGLVGAGGGFLIIPALVILSKLDMKKAIGTSLVIIAAKSLIGFLGDVSNYTIDWNFLVIFSLLSIAGIFVGSFLANKIDSQKLKVGFGWFVLVMGIFIFIKEFFL